MKTTLNRYLLFCGDNYYPTGGWGDFQGSYETYDEAMAALPTLSFDWHQIVDVTDGEVVNKD